MAVDATCPDCGGPTEDWKGEQVFPNYWYTAEPISAALSQIAKGHGYRQSAIGLRQASVADGAGGNQLTSKEPHVVQRLTEVLAPILHQALAPQVWPEGGLIAVDAVRFNLLGRHKYQDQKVVERTEPDLLEMLDPDELEDEEARRVLQKFLHSAPSNRPGIQGGVSGWQILGAYGYPITAAGEIPRTDGAGQPWLFRSYHQADALTWAHFFRQLKGTPAYILSDMAPSIAVGLELAWPDKASRPKHLICEYHVLEAIKQRIKNEKELQEEASKLFLTTGRWIGGTYNKDIPNGEVGSVMRLRHFARFRKLAREAEVLDFDRLFQTPTWRRIMDQVVNKNWKLRYSTGALESQLFFLGQRYISWRATYMGNRKRTDALLMLLQLETLQVATPAKFLQVIEHWLKHNPKLPKQERKTDAAGLPGSLHRPLTDTELQSVGVMTHQEFTLWSKQRHNRLASARLSDRYHRSPQVRKTLNKRRVARRNRNDPQNLARKAWYQTHRESEIQKATARKAKTKALAKTPKPAIIKGHSK